MTAEQLLREMSDLAGPFAVRVAATLRLADRIDEGRHELADLAAATGTHQAALGQLLRYLVRRGVLAETRPEHFELTDVGRLLRDGGPIGRRQWLDLDGLGFRMDMAYAGLLHSVRTGEPGYAAVHGLTLWADLDETPAAREYFDALMRAEQRRTAPQVARLVDWAGAATVLDVGGGNGGLLAEVLAKHGHLRGVLVDRSASQVAAMSTFTEMGVAERARFVAASFFEPLPEAADVVVVSRVLSDWPDAPARTILGHCAAAAPRVLVVEVLQTGQNPHFDLNMLVTVGGRERTVAEFEQLAGSAGLALADVLRGADGLVVLDLAARS
ncbi:methyltransferase [Pseudonocardia sp. TRM90224]|uniref:methyltransferase n=1 Tax=Pseudonocardia sp. TRM90224 TaxID=2812678 RepID=UPI001E4B65C3|nr:methyltransferase [Pseudonocardia sp. TRM90224]